VRRALDHEPAAPITLDLTRVRFRDASGLRLLNAVKDRAQERGQRLHIRSRGPRRRRIERVGANAPDRAGTPRVPARGTSAGASSSAA
jgi:anti-anti-sigma regulatory factor